VSLREITPANRAAVEALTVTAGQTMYVAGVAESLVEAAQTPDACPWYRAVYAGGTPVGFVMISDGITVVNPDYLGPYFLWRLLAPPARADPHRSTEPPLTSADQPAVGTHAAERTKVDSLGHTVRLAVVDESLPYP
jgi:hypothetical protein